MERMSQKRRTVDAMRCDASTVGGTAATISGTSLGGIKRLGPAATAVQAALPKLRCMWAPAKDWRMGVE